VVPRGDRRAHVVIADGCENQALASSLSGARQRHSGYDMGSSVSSVVPPLRIDCLKDRIACPTCEPVRPLDVPHPDGRFILFDPIVNFTRTFLEVFSSAPELRRLGVTQVDIWTRPAREVLETQARLCNKPWHQSCCSYDRYEHYLGKHFQGTSATQTKGCPTHSSFERCSPRQRYRSTGCDSPCRPLPTRRSWGISCSLGPTRIGT